MDSPDRPPADYQTRASAQFERMRLSGNLRNTNAPVDHRHAPFEFNTSSLADEVHLQIQRARSRARSSWDGGKSDYLLNYLPSCDRERPQVSASFDSRSTGLGLKARRSIDSDDCSYSTGDSALFASDSSLPVVSDSLCRGCGATPILPASGQEGDAVCLCVPGKTMAVRIDGDSHRFSSLGGVEAVQVLSTVPFSGRSIRSTTPDASTTSLLGMDMDQEMLDGPSAVYSGTRPRAASFHAASLPLRVPGNLPGGRFSLATPQSPVNSPECVPVNTDDGGWQNKADLTRTPVAAMLSHGSAAPAVVAPFVARPAPIWTGRCPCRVQEGFVINPAQAVPLSSTTTGSSAAASSSSALMVSLSPSPLPLAPLASTSSSIAPASSSASASSSSTLGPTNAVTLVTTPAATAAVTSPAAMGASASGTGAAPRSSVILSRFAIAPYGGTRVGMSTPTNTPTLATSTAVSNGGSKGGGSHKGGVHKHSLVFESVRTPGQHAQSATSHPSNGSGDAALSSPQQSNADAPERAPRLSDDIELIWGKGWDPREGAVSQVAARADGDARDLSSGPAASVPSAAVNSSNGVSALASVVIADPLPASKLSGAAAPVSATLARGEMGSTRAAVAVPVPAVMSAASTTRVEVMVTGDAGAAPGHRDTFENGMHSLPVGEAKPTKGHLKLAAERGHVAGPDGAPFWDDNGDRFLVKLVQNQAGHEGDRRPCKGFGPRGREGGMVASNNNDNNSSFLFAVQPPQPTPGALVRTRVQKFTVLQGSRAGGTPAVEAVPMGGEPHVQPRLGREAYVVARGSSNSGTGQVPFAALSSPVRSAACPIGPCAAVVGAGNRAQGAISGSDGTERWEGVAGAAAASRMGAPGAVEASCDVAPMAMDRADEGGRKEGVSAGRSAADAGGSSHATVAMQGNCNAGDGRGALDYNGGDARSPHGHAAAVMAAMANQKPFATSNSATQREGAGHVGASVTARCDAVCAERSSGNSGGRDRGGVMYHQPQNGRQGPGTLKAGSSSLANKRRRDFLDDACDEEGWYLERLLNAAGVLGAEEDGFGEGHFERDGVLGRAHAFGAAAGGLSRMHSDSHLPRAGSKKRLFVPDGSPSLLGVPPLCARIMLPSVTNQSAALPSDMGDLRLPGRSSLEGGQSPMNFKRGHLDEFPSGGLCEVTRPGGASRHRRSQEQQHPGGNVTGGDWVEGKHGRDGRWRAALDPYPVVRCSSVPAILFSVRTRAGRPTGEGCGEGAPLSLTAEEGSEVGGARQMSAAFPSGRPISPEDPPPGAAVASTTAAVAAFQGLYFPQGAGFQAAGLHGGCEGLMEEAMPGPLVRTRKSRAALDKLWMLSSNADRVLRRAALKAVGGIPWSGSAVAGTSQNVSATAGTPPNIAATAGMSLMASGATQPAPGVVSCLPAITPVATGNGLGSANGPLVARDASSSTSVETSARASGGISLVALQDVPPIAPAGSTDGASASMSKRATEGTGVAPKVTAGVGADASAATLCNGGSGAPGAPDRATGTSPADISTPSAEPALERFSSFGTVEQRLCAVEALALGKESEAMARLEMLHHQQRRQEQREREEAEAALVDGFSPERALPQPALGSTLDVDALMAALPSRVISPPVPLGIVGTSVAGRMESQGAGPNASGGSDWATRLDSLSQQFLVKCMDASLRLTERGTPGGIAHFGSSGVPETVSASPRAEHFVVAGDRVLVSPDAATRHMPGPLVRGFVRGFS